MYKGWFDVPNQIQGERTLKEQLKGLHPALQECAGKTVADLGTAEGLIAFEFARGGAREVYACDYNQGMLNYAESIKGNLPVTFEWCDLNSMFKPEALQKKYDIVLALAILHKLHEPRLGLKLITMMEPSLIVIRLQYGSTGILRSKHVPYNTCNINKFLRKSGYFLDFKLEGPREELVQYWRKQS